MNVLLITLGVIVTAIPFVVVSVYAAKSLGTREMVKIWLITFAIVGAILGGFALIGAGT